MINRIGTSRKRSLSFWTNTDRPVSIANRGAYRIAVCAPVQIDRWVIYAIQLRAWPRVKENLGAHISFSLVASISCLLLIILFFFFFSLLTTKEVKRCWKCQIETSVRVGMQASTMWFFPEDLMYEISCNEQNPFRAYRSPFMEGEG